MNFDLFEEHERNSSFEVVSFMAEVKYTAFPANFALKCAMSFVDAAI